MGGMRMIHFIQVEQSQHNFFFLFPHSFMQSKRNISVNAFRYYSHRSQKDD